MEEKSDVYHVSRSIWMFLELFFPPDNQTEICVFDANSHGAELRHLNTEVCCCVCVKSHLD